ncbi:MAG: 4-hydroxythreonine-4-phosphate dehydrogenase PdxA [Rhodobacteraceae bacterium]|nr:4-hydroxythreonine-4-phosphate dehydrogenase PdxA [Paracoccaceae bacterium]
MSKPVALTPGDPAGVGIELAVAAWKELHRGSDFFLFADRRQMAALGDSVQSCEINQPEMATAAMKDGIPFIHLDFPTLVHAGEPVVENSEAVIRAIEIAVDMAKGKKIAAVCTGPVNKRLLRQTGRFPYPGQTEFLQHICSARDVAMLLASPELRTVPVTIHTALRTVPAELTTDRIIRAGRITHDGLRRDLAIDAPRIAIAGLNPHAGEAGLMGDEDERVIVPAIRKLVDSGIQASGPRPADSLFHESARSSYDVALCMYHDQALIPVKTLDFFGTVNVTLGLPIIRTSPDHGTGFDIAGKGIARPESLIRAIEMAHEMAANRNLAV